jgi:bifunctional N-acetylglucosamine-1-phosphate-uridyltransferase/glucosamine-1-phosphate-acetyltransferase GlmU-like protein
LEGDLKRQTIIQTADKSFMTIEEQADGTQKQTIIQGVDTTILISKNSRLILDLV